MPPSTDILIGVSLGELHEPAGIVAVRRIETLGEYDGKRWPVLTSYRVQAVVGLPRIGSYDRLSEQVADILGMPPETRRSLVVDVSRSGRSVLPLMRHRRLAPLPVAIKEGIGASGGRDAFSIGRAELTTLLAVLIDQGRIDAADVPNADALARQLGEFTTAKRRKSEMVSRETDRQELVDALGMALWWGEKRLTNLTKQPPRPAPEIDCSPPTFDQAIKMLDRGRV